MREVVGGYIEPVHRVPLQVGRELVFMADEDGLRLGLPPTRLDIRFGDVNRQIFVST